MVYQVNVMAGFGQESKRAFCFVSPIPTNEGVGKMVESNLEGDNYTVTDQLKSEILWKLSQGRQSIYYCTSNQEYFAIGLLTVSGYGS